MADDRMKHDDQQRKMGSKGEGQDYSQQTPGRSGQQGGQQAGGQQQGGQKRNLNEDDDDFNTGGAGQKGGEKGGQNR